MKTSSNRGDVLIKVIKGNIVFQIPSQYAKQYFNTKQKYIFFEAKATSDNLDNAEQIRITLLQDLRSGKFNPTNLVKYKHSSKHKADKLSFEAPKTLIELWDKYCEYRKNDLSESSYLVHYRKAFYNLLKLCPQDINDQRNIRDFIIQNSKGTSRISRCLSQLALMIDWCISEDLLSPNTPNRFKYYHQDYTKGLKNKDISRIPPKTVQGLLQDNSVKAFTVEERDCIIHAYYNRQRPGYSQYPNTIAYLIDFLFHTGVRHGEAFALTWGDIAPDCSRITINKSYSSHIHKTKSTKTGKVRTFPVNEHTQKLLSNIRPSNPNPNELVFKTLKGGHFTPSSIAPSWYGSSRSRMKPLLPDLIKQGLVRQYLEPYSTRKTFITIQLEASIPIATIASWTGHDPSTLLTYYASSNTFIKPV